MSLCIVPYGYTKAKTLQLPHLRRILSNYFVLENTKRKLFLIFIYIDIYWEKPHQLTQKHEAVFNIGSRAFLWAFRFFVPNLTVCCKALQNKNVAWFKNCTKKISNIYPRLDFMHFITSNTKEEKSFFFVFELCTCLPRNSFMYLWLTVCMCVCV